MSSTQGIRAGRAFVELFADDTRLVRGLRQAEAKIKKFGSALQGLGQRMMGIGSAMLAPMLGAAKIFADVGSELVDMSLRTGVSVESLSALSYAAAQTGADMSQLEAGIRSMQRNLNGVDEESRMAQAALEAMGLSADALAGMTPEQKFRAIADGIAGISDAGDRAAVAMRVFGRSGSMLLPMLENGAKGLDEFAETAARLGLLVSSESAAAAKVFGDALLDLWKALKMVAFSVGEALAPSLQAVAQLATTVAVRVGEWIKQNRGAVVAALAVAAATVVAGAALVALGLAASLVGTLIGVAATAIAAIASPITLAVAAVAGLGVAIVRYTGIGGQALSWLTERFGELREWVGEVLGGITDALAAGDMALAAKVLWLSLKVAWQQGVAAINGVWLEAKEFFVSTAYDMWYGALAAAQTVLHALEVAWIETTAFLSKTWTNFATGFQMVWQQATSWVAKRMLEIQGLFDDGLDVEAAKKVVDQQLESRLVELENAAQQSVKAREGQREQQRRDAAAMNEATLAEIGRDLESAQESLRKDTAAGLAESQTALDAAKKGLADAIREARERRDASAGVPGPPGLETRIDADGIAEAIKGRVERIGVVGTFNPAAVFGLGGNSFVERTAAATEATAKNTKRLLDASVDNGLRFA